MKVNPFIEERDRVMASHGIPADKRAEQVKYLDGFCNTLNGSTTVVDEAIEYIEASGIKGDQAVKYVDEQIQKWDNHMSQSLIENMVTFDQITF